MDAHRDSRPDTGKLDARADRASSGDRAGQIRTAHYGDAATYWNRRAQDFGRIHPRLRQVRDLVEAAPRPVTTLLDIGCGPATLRSVLPRAIDYFGVDIAEEVIRALDDPSHFEVVDLNETRICFDGKRFDAVVCSGIFEYIREPGPFLDFVRDTLAPSGYLILTFTNHQHYHDRLRWFGRTFTGYSDPHANFLLIPEVVSLLRARGFVILRHRSTTWHQRSHPLLARFLRFPLNVLNREYLFLCERIA